MTVLIHRKMTLPSRDDLNLADVGVCWSRTEAAAHAHWGYDKGDKVLITLTARVSPEAIDQNTTAALETENREKWGTIEDEVRLNTGAAVIIIRIKTEKILTRAEQNEIIFGRGSKEDPIIENVEISAKA